MVRTAKHLLKVEKAWLLSQIGLIEDCDDDVMDEVSVILSFGVNLLNLLNPEAKMELLFLASVA